MTIAKLEFKDVRCIKELDDTLQLCIEKSLSVYILSNWQQVKKQFLETVEAFIKKNINIIDNTV